MKKAPYYFATQFNLGVTHSEKGEWDSAIKCFTNIPKEDPHYFSAQFNLGIVCYEKGEWNEEIKHYSNIPRKDPNYLNAQLNLGITYSEKGHQNEAIKHYTNVLKEGPNNLAAQFNLGTAYNEEGEWDKAIKHYTNVLKEGSNNLSFSAQLALGVAYGESNNLDAAIEHFTNAQKEEPNNPIAQYNLGIAYSKKNEWNKVIEHFTNIPKEDPNNLDAQYHLGIAYSEKGEWDKAINKFRKIEDQDPDYPQIGLLIKKALKKKNSIRKLDKYDKEIIVEKCELLTDILTKIQVITTQLTKNEILLFRGQSDAEWELIPSIKRQDKNYVSEEALLDNFNLRYTSYTKTELKTDLEKKAFMQHNEIPTSFLDWSESPLVALYFALSEAQNFNRTPITDIRLWVAKINTKNIVSFDELEAKSVKNPDQLFFCAPTHISNRITSQKGYFSYKKNTDNSCQSLAFQSGKLIVIDLETDFLGLKNQRAKKELKVLGITPTSIYPDMAGFKYELIGHSKEFTFSQEKGNKNVPITQSKQ